MIVAVYAKSREQSSLKNNILCTFSSLLVYPSSGQPFRSFFKFNYKRFMHLMPPVHDHSLEIDTCNPIEWQSRWKENLLQHGNTLQKRLVTMFPRRYNRMGVLSEIAEKEKGILLLLTCKHEGEF